MTSAPAAYDGELQELFDTFIEPNLPAAEDVTFLHRALLDYCRQSDPVFVVRKVPGVERRLIYTTAGGNRLKPSDNAPAWWMHFVAFHSIRDVDFEQMPTHFYDVGRTIPTYLTAQIRQPI
jgi:hypothetical protein